MIDLVLRKLHAVYEFGRPHTLAATSFQVVGVFAVVIAGERLGLTAWLALLLAWAGSLATNLYVVGLNQLYDLEIDRVNKPYLPLASGEISLRGGRFIVAAAGIISLMAGILGGGYLFATLLIVMLIGTLYSVPPLRFKMRAGWAALSISLARGLIANAGLFLYYEHALSPSSPLSRLALILGLSFFFLFGVVIAVFKDIPDWAGDHQYRVRTFAVVIGRDRIFKLGRWLLTGMYLLPVLGGLLLWPRPEGMALIAAHGAALTLFWLRSRLTDPNQPAAVMGLYRFLWILFYAEYIFLGIYRLILVKV